MFKSNLSVFLALFSIAACHDFEKEEGVLVLTDDNFDMALQHHPTMLVEFYAPWCGHCKSLAPEYAKAAQALEAKNSDIKLAKVDATVHKMLAEKFGIRGFPTLKFFQGEKQIEYTGGRTEETIIQWLEKKTGPQSVLVNSSQEIETMKQKQVTVVYFGAEDQHYQTFLKVAQGYEDVTFAHTFDEKLMSEMQATKVVLFKNFDEMRNNFEEEMTQENLEAFVEKNMIKTIMDFDQKAAEIIFSNPKETLFALYSEVNDATTAFRKVLEEASKQLKGKVLMSESNVSEGLGSRLAEFLGYETNTKPAFVMITFHEEDVQKYRFEGEHTVEAVMKFVNDVLEGKATPFLKSEEIPESNDAPVKVVVGKSFEQIVMDDSKDVLVEFYAPWCGHCKSLEPKYDELAKQLQNNKNIVIAKIDATANEVASVSVRSFPTIKLFARGKKATPMDFDGEREVEGFIKFLKENTDFQEDVQTQ